VTRTILLVDDDAEVLRVLGPFFEKKGWIVQPASAVDGAMDLYERERPDLVLLDIDLPRVSGLGFLEVLRVGDPDAAVIMLTGQADTAAAVAALRLGAEACLTKPVELAHLEVISERAFENADLRRRNRFFAERRSDAGSMEALGRTPLMRELARQVTVLADSDTTVLLAGETGTGKGFVAHLLHSFSRRASDPFLEISGAGLPSALLDSELFGHEKGAFTDAKEQKRGLFELAHGGTLFLDEVGDVSLELQPRLLEVLERQRFHRLGGTHDIEVDVRLIAATSIDLAPAVRAGRFRHDLYHKLNVLPLRLPPLRERGREEVADLSVRTLLDLRRRLGRGPDRLSADALEILVRYAWPGNIREMRNVLERVLLLSANAAEILPAHLPHEIVGTGGGPGSGADETLSLQEVERRHIARVLAHHRGNRSRAARTLGISRATLYEKLTRYGLAQIGRS
jgi:DNA-binding NtrC family response regulator